MAEYDVLPLPEECVRLGDWFSGRAWVFESIGSTVIGTSVEVHVHRLPARAAFDEVVRRPLEALGKDGVGQGVTLLVDALDESLTFPGENLVDLLAAVLSPASHPARRHTVRAAARAQESRVLDRLGPPDLDLTAQPQGRGHVAGYGRNRLAPVGSDLQHASPTPATGTFLYASYVVEDHLARPPADESASYGRPPTPPTCATWP